MSKKITLCLDSLCFEAIIGILKHERVTPQKVCVDAQILIDYDKNNFVDYAVVAKLIEKTIQEEKFFTIEEALLFLCKKIKKSYKNILKIDLKISKPNILKNVVVGAKITKKYRKNR